MTASVLDLYRLCKAYAAHLLAEAAFDRSPTVENAKAADRTYIAMVTAACACDPHALRSRSIKQWTEQAVAQFRDRTPISKALGQAGEP